MHDQVIEQNSVKPKKKKKKKYPIIKMRGGRWVLVKTTDWDLKFIVFICHVDGPSKLLTLGLVVDLLNGNAPLLTPRRQTKTSKRFGIWIHFYLVLLLHCSA